MIGTYLRRSGTRSICRRPLADNAPERVRMIEIGSSEREMDASCFAAPGGFAWWYLDLITPDGDGLVLIWALGLPFLPGYAHSARRGSPQRPDGRPSINVVVYRRGEPNFYLLQEYEGGKREEGRGSEASECLRFDAADGIPPIGRSRFRSWTEEGRRRVEVELDCPVPGSSERLTGWVRVYGVARRMIDEADEAAGAVHVWTPLTGPAEGEATLALGARPIARLRGRAYHDRNSGRVPLHALGIDHWIWSRFPLEGRELICYLLWPQGSDAAPRFITLSIDEQGLTRELPEVSVQPGRRRRGFGGISYPEGFRLLRAGERWAEVRHTSVVDNGPFYMRFQSEIVLADSERALGWTELCYPERVDRSLHRPLVRMRVHRVGGPNSLWLPLFSGPRGGRAGRWFRSLRASGAPDQQSMNPFWMGMVLLALHRPLGGAGDGGVQTSSPGRVDGRMGRWMGGFRC